MEQALAWLHQVSELYLSDTVRAHLTTLGLLTTNFLALTRNSRGKTVINGRLLGGSLAQVTLYVACGPAVDP